MKLRHDLKFQDGPTKLELVSSGKRHNYYSYYCATCDRILWSRIAPENKKGHSPSISDTKARVV